MTRNVDDLSLVQACRAGRTEAYGLLVRRCQDRLFPTILRLMGSHEDAQDVLQDAFVRGFEKLDQYHGDSSFYTWIYRIAVNLALTRFRRRRLGGVLRLWGPNRGQLALDPPDQSPGVDPAFAMEQAEREAVVAAALGELAPEQRAVVVLKDFDGRRYEEISEILNIPIGTVRSRLHRARSQLRDRLRSLVEDADPALPDVESVRP
ncbi:MAG: sigma-70 family RNA polymerase sigma factor [Paludisphaera borealis]|uniref:RNA polymerase sigma factor n=1 Tax=Paludisphaera borealis TaxID=1387353 RepID=UPI00284AF87F|nr:sigma-70 family RNA polymerase sigma factor [Paludisphaera borealis]MDR3618171.1 sigma-70 family RNA polymerase sigma factor [Paludisphaera borealis]